MKFFKPLVASSLLVIATFGSLEVVAEETKAFIDGSIKFLGRTSGENEGSYPCEILLKSGQTVFTAPDSPCSNDRDNYFRLEDAPSATIITLHSGSQYDPGPPMIKRCYLHSGTALGWKFVLKTYMHPTKTDWISISELSSTDVGTIVKKGVILVSKDLKSGDYIDELSCVEVERSALP